MWTWTMNLTVYCHVLLKKNVSIQISYFPGFSKTVDCWVFLPRLTSIDISLFLISSSLKSSNLSRIEFKMMLPFLGISYFFYFFFSFSITWFFNCIYLFFWIWNSSFSFLVLKMVYRSNSSIPIYLWVFFTMILSGSLTWVLTSFL